MRNPLDALQRRVLGVLIEKAKTTPAGAMGDLRARAARMEPIADLAELKPVVEGLIERGLIIELTPSGRGQIVSHNLYLPPELADLRSEVARLRDAVRELAKC